MAKETVDNLEERLLHAGKAFIQQLRDEDTFSEQQSMQLQNLSCLLTMSIGERPI